MPRSAEEISRAIRAQLKILDPDISAEPLTPERKIIDTVAEQIALAEIDKYVLDYQYDIDTKVGEDLDRFVALFGFARQAGRRATGSVTFSRSTPADRDMIIPSGTQVVKPATSVTPAVIFRTTTTATIYTGTTSAEASIECAEVGSIGNVSAATITSLGSSGATEVSSITNENATTGGSNYESDAALRIRFKNTIFRNIAGTRDQYLALAIASRFAKKASVIGPQSRFSEHLQIEADGTILSQNPYADYIYDFDYYLTDGVPGAETFYSPEGNDYSLAINNGVSPATATITVTNSDALPTNALVLFEHTYCSLSSRNDPANNVFNAVDVFVSGQDAVTVTESVKYPTSANNFVNNTASKFHYQNYVRYGTTTNPTIGNRLQILLWQPVIGLPNSITVGANTYTEGTHYWLVVDDTKYHGSRRARCGIEWASGLGIVDGTEYTFEYDFDRLPLELNELMDAHKQVTADVLVHSARERYFNVYLTVMYASGFSPAAVDTAITTALTDFMERQNFGALIQISDIVDVAHDVDGVDNVRLTNAADGAASHGVQEVDINGVNIGSPYTNDFALKDSDLPVLNSVITVRRSQNTWSFS